MSSIQARKDEIQAKRTKLAELKRVREQRQKEFSTSRQSVGGEQSELIAPAPSRANRAELDSLISSLVDRPRNAGSPGLRSSRPSSVASPAQLEPQDGQDSPTRQSRSPVSSQVAEPQTLAFAPLRTVYDVPSSANPEVITYSKGVQTADSWTAPMQDGLDRSGSEDENTYTSPRRRKRLSRRERERDEELRQNLRKEIEAELKALQIPEQASRLDGTENFPARTLTHEELNAVTGSEDFLGFIERSSKVIERALDEEYDVLADYAFRGSNALDEDGDDDSGTLRNRRGRRIREIHQFQDDRWTKRRMISDLDFSPKYPELLLASYTKAANSAHTSPGLALIWNAHMPSRPEYTFTANSDILSARFAPHHPNLILGGTYSGQVCLWDTRQRSHDGAPVQRTPLAGERGGHAHPIYSVAVVGTQNASNIISVSTDGTTCAWSFDMLSKPQEFLELTSPPGRSRTEDVSPTCISFQKADPTYFLAGTEEGSILPVHRYDRAGAKAGIDSRIVYRGHAAPVSGLDFHPSRGKVDLGDLALSSSLDWTIKLWRVRPHSSALSAANANTQGLQIERPLLDIMREDVVYDVKWSPTKPGVFGNVDGAGRIEIFDLAIDTEVPVARAMPSHAQADIFGIKSLNKLAWEHNEGKKVAVGGLDGVATMFEVGSDLGGTEGLGNMDQWMGMKKMVGRLDKLRGTDGR